MKYNRYAVIDLGTNTFHLLIVEPQQDGSFEEIYRERIFVKLAEDGIQKIGEQPFGRGLQALQKFRHILEQYDVPLSRMQAFGTAALRTASNGLEFIKTAFAKTNINIQLITGEREASLIHKGVAQAVVFGKEKGLIMDIGGGSVEFIIADAQQVYWEASFPIGVAVLYKNFHRTEPMSSTDITALEHYLSNVLQPLLNAILRFSPVTTLIGASGTFDVLENLLAWEKPTPFSAKIKAEDFPPLYQRLIAATDGDRRRMEGVPLDRADMIVVAVILVKFILEKTDIKEIQVSSYAMKEGMLYEML